MKIFILTFGCKVNQYESEAILENFCESGFIKSDSVEDADIIILNSCTVTAQSDKKVLRSLKKIRKDNQNAILVLTGCIPQAFPEQTINLYDADIIIGNSGKNEIFSAVLEFLEKRNKIISINPYKKDLGFEKVSINGFNERARAFLKIEDGCNRFCTYCIIPYARGRVRSKPVDEILNEVKALSEKKYKEIVLVGINLSAYGLDIGLTLCDAIEAVCSVEGIERVRLSSLEPEQLNEATIKRLAKQSKLCPHFHLSLQSGCDETLKRMNRHYNSAEYFEIVNNLRKYFTNASITTDMMVGFAGETEDEFNKSLSFVRKVGFAKTHVFSYSVRPGTKAAQFPDQIDNKIKKIRSNIMIKETDKSRVQFFKSQVGNREEVLYENRGADGYFHGYTRNYTPVKIKTDKDLHSKILMTDIIEVEDDFCFGQLI